MIPLARKLMEMNNTVFIASGEEHLSLFRSELPGLSYLSLPGFNPGYSRRLPQYLSLLLKVPLLLWHIGKEHHRVKKLISDNNIDIIISDNRFGLWNRKIISVYVTHMPRIPLPRSLKFLEPAGVYLHRQIINKFTYCFIPDLPGDLNLSGRLSHGIKLPDNVRYIGILSKFNVAEQTPEIPSVAHHDTVILSGPEPQREIFKQILVKVLKDNDTPVMMFEGKPLAENGTKKNGSITFYNHLPASKMKTIIEHSRNIITRSGYTTIMELVSLNCTALIIPTPGQTEQEYLAEYLSKKGWFSTITQNEIGSKLVFCEGKNIHDEINRQSNVLLSKALNELSDKHHKDR